MAARAIHVFSPHAPRFAALIAARAPERDLVLLRERAELDACLGRVRVLFAPFPPSEGWGPAARLELLQLCGVGVDHFLPSPDLPASVEIAGMRGAMAPDVAEHAMLMLLALTRDLPHFAEAQRQRVFEQRMVPRLRGAKLAIVGFGSIGRALAARARGFGVRVRGLRRHPGAASPPAGVEEVVPPAGLHELLAWCDAVVVCTPRTAETRGSIGAEALNQLHDGAILINVARGGIVHEGPLLDRLRAGTLRAALDVFEDEPLDETSPFWDAPNTIVTPHVAGYGEGYLERSVELLLDNVARLERGEPREGLVDRALGY